MILLWVRLLPMAEQRSMAAIGGNSKINKIRWTPTRGARGFRSVSSSCSRFGFSSNSEVLYATLNSGLGTRTSLALPCSNDRAAQLVRNKKLYLTRARPPITMIRTGSYGHVTEAWLADALYDEEFAEWVQGDPATRLPAARAFAHLGRNPVKLARMWKEHNP